MASKAIVPSRTCGFESHPGYFVRPSRNNANVRSIGEVREVAALVASGMNDCAIARRTGIPRGTVRDWRHERRWERWPYSAHSASCLRCGAPEHAFDMLPSAYVYLLGMYLGDGHVVECPKKVYRLTIAIDAAHPRIIGECVTAIAAIVPGARPRLQPQKNSRCVWIVKYSKRWPCLFPQHGPGRKHERPIVLRSWQHALVARDPEWFLRGLIHSDGCRFTNPVRHGEKLYEYPRYNFSNASADIRKLFCDACDLLGIEWRVMNARNISVARRASVARLDAFVGPKR